MSVRTSGRFFYLLLTVAQSYSSKQWDTYLKKHKELGTKEERETKSPEQIKQAHILKAEANFADIIADEGSELTAPELYEAFLAAAIRNQNYYIGEAGKAQELVGLLMHKIPVLQQGAK